jgi:hypothetical protein
MAKSMNEDRSFQEIVSAYLTMGGNPRVIADEFEAAVSTVGRWASGHARPRSRMQQEIVRWIKAHGGPQA